MIYNFQLTDDGFGFLLPTHTQHNTTFMAAKGTRFIDDDESAQDLKGNFQLLIKKF